MISIFLIITNRRHISSIFPSPDGFFVNVQPLRGRCGCKPAARGRLCVLLSPLCQFAQKRNPGIFQKRAPQFSIFFALSGFLNSPGVRNNFFLCIIYPVFCFPHFAGFFFSAGEKWPGSPGSVPIFPTVFIVTTEFDLRIFCKNSGISKNFVKFSHII